jgi:hypothetical protein
MSAHGAADLKKIYGARFAWNLAFLLTLLLIQCTNALYYSFREQLCCGFGVQNARIVLVPPERRELRHRSGRRRGRAEQHVPEVWHLACPISMPFWACSAIAC